MPGFAILVKGMVVPCEDVSAWAKWFKVGDRVVKKTDIETKDGLVTVSTVFLGLDHGFGGPSRWFETLTFGGKLDQEMERYETISDAERGHDLWCQAVREGREL